MVREAHVSEFRLVLVHKLVDFCYDSYLADCLSALCSHPASYLYPSFQGLMSDNDTVRLGLDFQRMLRINRMLYIAARSVAVTVPHSSPELIRLCLCSFVVSLT